MRVLVYSDPLASLRIFSLEAFCTGVKLTQVMKLSTASVSYILLPREISCEEELLPRLLLREELPQLSLIHISAPTRPERLEDGGVGG